MDLNKEIIRYFRMRHNQGLPLNSSRGTRTMLAQFFNIHGLVKGVEIGTWRGDHAKVMADNINNIDLTCIDPWTEYSWHNQAEQDGYYEQTKRNLSPYPNVKILRMASMAALPLFEDTSLDFVHIDGNHDFDYAVMDIICWHKKLKHGGIMAVHDYDSYMTGVVRAVDAYTSCHGINPWFVLRESGRHPVTAFWVNP